MHRYITQIFTAVDSKNIMVYADNKEDAQKEIQKIIMKCFPNYIHVSNLDLFEGKMDSSIVDIVISRDYIRFKNE